jgi:DNA-binding LacI/PurR family transcriptional regulator
MGTTLKDVAKKAGVSKTTVSLVLNKGDSRVGISNKTRDAILTAVKDLNYRPNAFARGLAVQRANTIGVGLYSVDYLNEPTFSAVVSGVAHGAGLHGFNLQFAVTSRQVDPSHQNLHFLNAVEEARIDGLIIMDQAMSEEDISTLRKRRISFVLVDMATPDQFVPCIDIDYHAGVLEAVGHLVKHGHKKISIIVSNSTVHTTIALLDAYRTALRTYALEKDMAIICKNIEEFPEKVVGMVQSTDRPTAVLTADCFEAVLFLKTVRRLGIHIPTDLALIAYNEKAVCMATHPTMSGLMVPWYDIGNKAVEVLIRIINGKGSTSERFLVKPTLNPRESCGCKEKEEE